MLCSPILLIAVLTIRFTMGAPVLFTARQRPGFQGKPFKVYKFRTMNNLRDQSGNLLPDERRLTRVGSLLRKSSIDELPELVNVLRGEMSLVGPRPLLYSTSSVIRPSRRAGMS